MNVLSLVRRLPDIVAEVRSPLFGGVGFQEGPVVEVEANVGKVHFHQTLNNYTNDAVWGGDHQYGEYDKYR